MYYFSLFQNGNIFVFSGMLTFCDASDDELAVALSHEIAHCLLGHAAENLSYVNFVHMALLVPLAVLWALLPNDGIAIVADWFSRKVVSVLLELPFSRGMEKEADDVGLILAAKSCFDVRKAPAFWGKMAAVDNEKLREELEDKNIDEDALKAARSTMALVMTHPPHEQRQKNLEDQLARAMQLRLDCGCYKL